MKCTVKDILKATNGRLINGNEDLRLEGITIDTRKVQKGELFVAIKGAHFDGHDFLADAAGQGASALVVKKGTTPPKNVVCIEVADAERALGDIAKWWRSKFKIPVVGITGSNGKSTTKEMISAIAGALGEVLKTEGNFNNLIGLPLTIFRLNESHRVAIIEMGMNAPGEIARLAEIANPDIGIITNVTSAHLEKLHTVEAVANAKGELFDTMRADACAVINAEDPWVKKVGDKRSGKKIFFGMQNGLDVQFLHMDTNSLDSMELKFSVSGKEYKAKLPVPGAHNVMNALAAVSLGVALGVDIQKAVEKLENFHPMSMRFERVQLANGVRVVNDSYNANPESMRAAFRTVGSAKRAGRFVAALGDMLELGDSSAELHKQVGMVAAQMGVESLYLVGDFAEDIAEGAKQEGLDNSQIFICTEGAESVGRILENELHTGDVLLVKGSRGMKMERVVEYLKSSIGMG